MVYFNDEFPDNKSSKCVDNFKQVVFNQFYERALMNYGDQKDNLIFTVC
jgi:hypothetical protein